MFGRAAAGLLTLSIGSYGAIALSLVVSVVLTRSLGAEGYGRLAVLLVASQVLVLIVSNWTLTTLVRFGAREWSTGRAIAATFWARTVVLAPGVVLVAVAATVLSGPLDTYLAVGPSGTLLVFLLFIASSLSATFGAVLQASDRVAVYGAVLVVEKAALLILVLATSGSRDPRLALLCYALAALLATTWAIARIGLGTLAPVRPTASLLREQWMFSLPLVAGSWAGLFGNQIVDFAVIRQFLPFEEIGRYALAYQLAGVVQQMTIVVSTFLLPRYSAMLARGAEAELRAIVPRLTPYFLLAFSVAAGLGIVVGPFVVPIVFGEPFFAAVAPFSLLLVASTVAAAFAVYNPVLTAYGAVWPMTRAAILGVSFNVLMDLLLVPPLGITGAAAATLTAYIVSASLSLVAAQWGLGFPALRGLAFVLPALAVWMCSVLVSGPAFYAVSVAALVVATGALVGGFGLFCAEDRALLTAARSW